MEFGQKMKPCEGCNLTGFSDKIGRGAWTMEPRDRICRPCNGRGWVPDKEVNYESQRDQEGVTRAK